METEEQRHPFGSKDEGEERVKTEDSAPENDKYKKDMRQTLYYVHKMENILNKSNIREKKKE